jgi:SAM-dependent methyltransferase
MKNSRAHLFSYASGAEHEGRDAAEVFTKIHESHEWNIKTTESVSGEGSTLEQTKVLIAELPSLLRKLGVKSFLDLPCGDFNWMQHVDFQNIKYTGGDIVEALVEKNNARFASENRQFLHLNLLADPLPACDLIFCRDCLVHLSFSDIHAALANIKRSAVTYLATTHFHEEPENVDIPTGGWRPLNFFKPPFNFPEPVVEINEQCTEMDGVFADKCMVVWKISDL